MVTAAWKSYTQIDPSKTYFAYAAYIERRTAWSYFSYLMRAGKVQKQLGTAKGLIGFTARLEFFNKKVTQLAVFEDENALRDFAHSGQHALCSEQTKPTMEWMKNTTWKIAGSELPPNLEDAIKRLQSQNSSEHATGTI